jgi:hypothetical protein
MNCQDISRILDSRDVNALSTTERRACEAHAASCRHCGPEWVVYSRLAAIPAPAMPREVAVKCETLAAARPGAAGGFASGRTVLLGAILVATAAATMLGLSLRREAVPQVIAESVVPALPEDAINRVSAAESTTPGRDVPAPPSLGSFTVHLRPLQYDSPDALALHRVREYYDAFANGLLAVPGLHLVNDEAVGQAEAPADFRVTITNPGPAIAQQALIFSEWAATASVEVLNGGSDGAAGPTGTVYDLGMIGDAWGGSSRPGVETRGPLSGECNAPRFMPCLPADIAERQVMALRKHVFPRDGTLERELEVQFLEQTQPERDRNWVMSDLLSMKMTLSDAMVREALARIARPQDANEAPRAAYDRANLLVLLVGQRHPEMVQPLIDMARYDADVSFRIEVVKLLAADFPTDPAVRAALEDIAADPSTPTLQAIAAGLIRGSPGG